MILSRDSHLKIYLNSLLRLFLLFSILLNVGCDKKAQVLTSNGPTYNCEKAGNSLQFDCPALPNTNLSVQPDFDIFAWNSFIALNWPALVQENTLQRGIPDLKKSFLYADHNDVLVWETFKEKREVFNVPQDSNKKLLSWNHTPSYGSLRAGSQISTVPGALPSDAGSPNGIIWNTLDETIEVKSESLEGNSSTNLAYGHVVSPRVWRGDPSEGNPVLYEVKVNYDFYNYVSENKFYVDSIASKAANASDAGIRLPWRTSADSAAIQANIDRKKQLILASGGDPDTFNVRKNTNNPNRVTNYLSSDALTSYVSANTNPDTSSVPFSQGAVHVKAAWIQLKPEDDTSSFHTTVAEYYKTGASGIQKQYATFGLVGLHIIQRVHLGDPGDTFADKEGGTFIFATWEHLQDTIGFKYSNYRSFQGTGVGPANIGWYPHKDHPADSIFIVPGTYDVKRKFPILPITDSINQVVWNALPANSVWRNYQLIGTQFQAVKSLPESDSLLANYNDPMNINQPQYLANLVIETNEGLQHFQGQPPLTTTTSHFDAVKSNDFNGFNRHSDNMQWAGNAYNMGGCMGCHGVAQTEGYSFSFVLLGGYEGATTDTDSLFDLPPPPLPKTE